MVSAITGTLTVLVVEPTLNIALIVDVSKSSPKIVALLHSILCECQLVLVADGGDSTDGNTETLNGLAILPEGMDSDTGTDLDISLPVKVGAENSTCRTADHWYNEHNHNIYVSITCSINYSNLCLYWITPCNSQHGWWLND